MSEYFIQCEDRAGRRSIVPVARFPFSIGRGPENNLVIAEPSVSRVHAYLEQSPEGVSVVDNESRNGVFVNNEKISRPRLITPSDYLRIGTAWLRLQHSEQSIPRNTRGTETIEYFPSRDTWDSIRRPESAVTRVGPPRDGSSAPDWRRLLSRQVLESPLGEIAGQVLDLLRREIPFDRGFVGLFDPLDPEQIQVAARRVHRERTSEVIVSRSVLRRVRETCEAVIVTEKDYSRDQMKSFIKTGAATAICVPLLVGGSATGVIYLDRVSSSSNLTSQDIEAIGPLAGLVALKIENLRLQDEHRVFVLQSRELERAQAIQKSLLPQAQAVLPGYAVEGFSSPCYQVGGDYYDFVEEGGSLTFLVGDVSGKGLPSAMYMASVRAAIHAHLGEGLSIGALVARLERNVQSTFRTDHFLTLCIGRLDPADGLLTYCNAGHLPPIVLRADGSHLELETTDPALNLMPWREFHCREHRLLPGDLFLLYTDGLVEAESAEGEQFGLERLVLTLKGLRGFDLPRIRAELIQEIDRFSAGCGPSDDRTLVLISRERS